MEHLSRFFIGSILLGLVKASHTDPYIFTVFVLTTFVVSIFELLTISTKYLKYTRLIILINYLWVINVIYNLRDYKQVVNIMIYNSVSDIIQYIVGRTMGNHKPFSFTSKSLEGYVAGILVTQLIFKYEFYFVILNMIGMLGGIFSSIIKRRMKIKHWSTLLGSHGGINDRLDSLCAPIIIYLNFIK